MTNPRICQVVPSPPPCLMPPFQWSAQPRGPHGSPWLGKAQLQPQPCAWWQNCPGSGPTVLLSHPQPEVAQETHTAQGLRRCCQPATVPSSSPLGWGPLGSCRPLCLFLPPGLMQTQTQRDAAPWAVLPPCYLPAGSTARSLPGHGSGGRRVTGAGCPGPGPEPADQECCVHHMRVGEVVPRAVTDRFADRGRNILCSGWVGVDELRVPV